MPQLPFDIKYMQYYLRDTLYVEKNPSSKKATLCIKDIDKASFAQRMEGLQREILGDDRKVQAQYSTGSGKPDCNFMIYRNGREYEVSISNSTKPEGKYRV